MQPYSYSQSPYTIREDMSAAYREFWARLAKPGSWWTGAERIAIAQESRNAVTCGFCAERKQALSGSVTGITPPKFKLSMDGPDVECAL